MPQIERVEEHGVFRAAADAVQSASAVSAADQFVFTELKEAGALYEKVQKWCERNTKNRMVISIYGGSGSYPYGKENHGYRDL